nr:2Fe-2S ferredoxin-type iron [Kaumoebavirus]
MAFKESRLCKALVASTVILGSMFIATLLFLVIPKHYEDPPLIFNHTREIDGLSLRRRLREVWPQKNNLKIPYFYSDACYLLYSRGDFEEFQALMAKHKFQKYSHEFNDCDDFAAIARGIERQWFTSHKIVTQCGSAFALLKGYLNYYPIVNCTENRGHVMNLFIDTDLTVWGYEPQNNKLYLVPDEWCNNTFIDRITV